MNRAKVLAALAIVVIPIAVAWFPYAPEITGAALACAFILVKPGSPATELGLRRPPGIVRVLTVGMAAGLAFVLVNRLWLTPVAQAMTGMPRDLAKFDALRNDWRALLTLLPVVWVSAALCEEIVFRGFLLTKIAELFGNSRRALGIGVAGSSLLFGLVHWAQGATGMLVTGALAVPMGLLYLWQRRNLWCNVVAHGIADTVSLAAIVTGWDRVLDATGQRLFFNQ
jgi:membrane protease YdiL (CAAX protease family)